MDNGQSCVICYGMIPEDVITVVGTAKPPKLREYRLQIMQTIKRILSDEDEATLKDDKKMQEIMEDVVEGESFRICGDWEIYFSVDTIMVD